LEFKQISNDTAKEVLFETENLKAKSAKKKPMREGLRGDERAKKSESKKSEQNRIKAERLNYKGDPSSSKIIITSFQSLRRDYYRVHLCLDASPRLIKLTSLFLC